MQNLCLGFWKLGVFENWVRILNLVENFSILWLGWVPFGVCASVLAPCGNLSMYSGIFPYVHAFSINILHCCMSCVWQIVLNSTEFQSLVLVLFDHMNHVLINLCVFYTLCFLCASMPCHAHIRYSLGISRHTSCTSRCTHKHQQMHSLCTF